jgi:hypothetical protein
MLDRPKSNRTLTTRFGGESDAHDDWSLRNAPFDQRSDKLGQLPRRENCLACTLDLSEFPPSVAQDYLDLNRFQSTGLDFRRFRPRQEEALTLSISRPTKVEFVFTHPDTRTQYCRGLTYFFTKLAQGGLSVRLPRNERAARSDPNSALILGRPDMLEKDPVLRVQQYDARGGTIDNLLGHPGTITRATFRAAAHNSLATMAAMECGS